MTGYDIQLYQRTKEVAKYLKLELAVSGDRVAIGNPATDVTLGFFNTVEEAYAYLCGYETGQAEGKKK